MKIEAHDKSKKEEEMLRLLKFGTVMVFVDSRHGDVAVPEQFKNDFQLRLNFDYAFEIDDFQVLPDRIEGSLSFNRKNFFCIIPFDAIYLMLNHFTRQGSLFVESVPSEMLDAFSTMSVTPGKNKKPGRNRSHLRVVK